MFQKRQLEKKQFKKSYWAKGANKHRRLSFTEGKVRQKKQEITRNRAKEER